MTASSDITTLFSEMSASRQRPTSFALSVMLHGFLGAILWFSATYRPPIRHIDTEHLSIRELDLFTPDDQQTASTSIPYPGPRVTPRIPKLSSKPAHSSSAPSTESAAAPRGAEQQAQEAPAQAAPAPPPPQLEEVKTGPQTLIQADLPKTISLKDEIPVPQVMVWSAAKTPATKITPPSPQKMTAADVKPTLEKPTPELNLADIDLASSKLPSPTQPVLASTTSPVSTPAKPAAQLPPVTSAPQKSAPTPAAILSLSDLRTKTTSAVLPAVSEAVNVKPAATSAIAQGKSNSAQSGTNTAATKPGTGTRTDSSKPSPNASTGKASLAQSSPASAKNSSSNASGSSAPAKTNSGGSSPLIPASGSKPETAALAPALSTALNSMGQPAFTQIDMPKDGHFGAVIVGNSLEDEFPEISGVWHGRVAYTAYLHVGLSKSWILQYSLPRSVDASDGGAVMHLEAPWPFNIVRPNLTTGSVDADALMIHGFINPAGRFEALNVVFPESFPQTQFVLTALQQWVFRPALQNGQATRVEVLLIIPDTYE